jgi:hypothetical protein
MNTKIVFVALMGLLAPLLVMAGGPHAPRHDTKLHAKVVLVGTSNAPAAAKGRADLNSDAKNDHTKSKLKIHTDHLDAGDYVLSIVRISDGTSVVLGPATAKTNGHLEHEGKTNVPSDVGNDIAQIVLADSIGNAVLVGDLVNPAAGSKIDYKATVDIEPGPAAPDAKGKASIHRMSYHGKLKERFHLHAEHVPANATFDILVDGTNAGQAVSNHDGHVQVKSLSGVNLSTVHVVQLTDATGNVVLTANF